MAKGKSSRLANWLVGKSTKSLIHKIVKQKRLVFTGDNQADYTDKNGIKTHVTFSKMAGLIMRATGGQASLFGMNEDDIKNMIKEEYQKQKEVKK